MDGVDEEGQKDNVAWCYDRDTENTGKMMITIVMTVMMVIIMRRRRRSRRIKSV